MAQTYERKILIGRWFRSEELIEGNRYCELATLKEDGQFEFNFITYALDGKVTEDVTEYGLWGLVGNIHFTITQAEGETDGELYSADPTHEENYHAYQVTELTEDKFTYQHIGSGEVFTMKRIKPE